MMFYLRNISSGEIFFGIADDQKKKFRTSPLPILKRKDFLKILENFLRSSHSSISSLTGIIVSTTQGELQGFSQLRMIIAIADALAFSLKIPIWGVQDKEWNMLWEQAPRKPQKKPKRFVFPHYNKEPNIT